MILSTVTITHYCNCKQCCGKSPGDRGYGITADGTVAKVGTIAADWSVIAKHSRITYQHGGKTYSGVVHDRGGAIKGRRIDVWCQSHGEALRRGKFVANLIVTAPATGAPPPLSVPPISAEGDFPFARYLKQGQRGADVEQLQQCLRVVGHAIAVDGKFGPQTDRALRALQQHAGLKADGIVGPRTWEAISRQLVLRAA